MILRSITVRSWRCFLDETRVGPFDEGLNVIHAPNATGKSTLFDAMTRCLVDSHRVSGQKAETLRPRGRSLAPVVTVEFASGGDEYRLTKRFLDSPSSMLERWEQGRFVPLHENDAADDHVRDLLSTEAPGRGLSERKHWGMAQALWVPIDHHVYRHLDRIARITMPRGIPIVSSQASTVETHAVVAVAVDYRALGTSSVVLTDRVLRGEKEPGELPVGRMRSYRVLVNLDAARRTGFEVPLTLLATADRITDREEER